MTNDIQSDRHDELVSQIVSISAGTWCSLIFLALLAYPVLLMSRKQITLVVTFLALFFFALSVGLWTMIDSLLIKLTPSVPLVRDTLINAASLEAAIVALPKTSILGRH